MILSTKAHPIGEHARGEPAPLCLNCYSGALFHEGDYAGAVLLVAKRAFRAKIFSKVIILIGWLYLLNH